MAITLFPHQLNAITEAIKSRSQGNKNILIVLPTGAGKTLVMAEFARRTVMNNQACIVFAHRDVLLSQISDAFCMLAIRHTFIASKPTINDIANMHVEEHGRSFYDETSPVMLASVDTFIRRIAKGQVDHLSSIVTEWYMDEAHHTLADNKWGACVNALKNASGIGVTATPIRGDGKGLGRGKPTGKYDDDGTPILDNDGVFDDMIAHLALRSDLALQVGKYELVEMGRRNKRA